MDAQRLEARCAESDERAADLCVLDYQHRVVPPRLVGEPLSFDYEVEPDAGDDDDAGGEVRAQEGDLGWESYGTPRNKTGTRSSFSFVEILSDAISRAGIETIIMSQRSEIPEFAA